MKNVVIGLLGTTLDIGNRENRWEKWRPSIAVCQQEDLLIDRFELLYQQRYRRLAQFVINDISCISPETEVRSQIIEFSDPWDFENVYASLHDFARSYRFDPDNEEYLVHITTGTHVAQICLFLLTESCHIPGKLLQTGPDKKKKNCGGNYRIIDLDLSKYDNIAMRFLEDKRDDISFLKSGIDTKNRQFNELIERIEQVAIHSTEPMLLTGPTGAGKSQLARRIFELKKHRSQIKGRFVELNCATIRGDGAMSALFGHVKGSFTGAVSGRDGALKSADKGILFLDEIGELGLDEQAMLLRAIEEKVFMPVGSDSEVESDFQIICGTNRDLYYATVKGTFRDDLLSRINLWTFTIPGLKDRREDIEPNLGYELDRFTAKTGKRVTFNKEAREKFLSFALSPEASWEANFRDLNGTITRMATLAPGGRITADVVAVEISYLTGKWRATEKERSGFSIIRECMDDKQYQSLDLFDKYHLAGVITVCRKAKNISDAGRMLFSQSRQKKKSSNDSDRLKKYLEKFGLRWEDVQMFLCVNE